ncbi:hypothetical protein LU196_13470 [Pantoea sp. Mb-10]|uniref:hypothetical protein n=1 Tax=unclassified Pantoea TaxID=2630326 RepID=UPI001E41E90E|nr:MULTISPECIES: hypothetical protein [unclassified Pantoea]MCE0491051.1 hypothetical protein [Pantoea sp. Mb-10]MCE0502540.1 hypothetical protein [Pantoea sp. Pb-8]
MKRSKFEKLTDIMIGEAVVGLLAQEGRVDTQNLSASLSAMGNRESDPDRLEALRIALDEVQHATLTTPIASLTKKH